MLEESKLNLAKGEGHLTFWQKAQVS